MQHVCCTFCCLIPWFIAPCLQVVVVCFGGLVLFVIFSRGVFFFPFSLCHHATSHLACFCPCVLFSIGTVCPASQSFSAKSLLNEVFIRFSPKCLLYSFSLGSVSLFGLYHIRKSAPFSPLLPVDQVLFLLSVSCVLPLDHRP